MRCDCTDVRGSAFGRDTLSGLGLLAIVVAILASRAHAWAADGVASMIPDWADDALVIVNPAAAVGGCQAGIYTPAVNGVQPWRQAMIRWLTGRHVMGNTAVLVRQEGMQGGAGSSAIIDPDAEYRFDVSAFVSHGGMFGDRQVQDLRLMATVLDADDRLIAEAPIASTGGKWASASVSFHSGRRREVRCVVRAIAPDALPCFYYADEYRLVRKDQSWWSPENLLNASRTAVRLKDQRDTLIRTMDPDVIGGHNGVYLNWDGYFTRRGIAVGGGQWEQEYNHLGIDDPLADQFRDNGMARERDGRLVEKSGLWPGYNMCHSAPLWHTYQRDRMVRIAPDVDVISQDNICAPSFEQAGKGCFCRWCREAFRAWLTRRWNAEQFRSAGIAEPTSFDIVQYLGNGEARIAKGRDAVLADPVLRAFIQFHYATQLDLWRDNVQTAKRLAGHPILVCGNQWGAGGQRPFCVALSQVSDAAVVETGGGPFTARNRAWDALATKLPLAAGEYRRPVWLYMTSLFHAAAAGQSRLCLNIAQAWADGGVPCPWATAAGASGWFYDREATFAQFIQHHRALFSRRDRVANVGLVYSLPTHAWRQFRAFNLSPNTYRQWFVAWAQLLEETHVPYEVNCWWHPLLGDDRVSLERLNRYQVLILPGIDCFTDAQREAVRTFQSRGGRVIGIGCPKSYDADSVVRPDGETLAVHGQQLIEVDPATVTACAVAGEKPTPENLVKAQAAAPLLQAALQRALAHDQVLQTDASRMVWANLWLDDTRQVLALHLVNGDIDTTANHFRPVENCRWRLRLPAGLKVTDAVTITPDAENIASQAKPIEVKVADGWATLIVPRLESYTVVALFTGEALTATSDLAQARRAAWRVSLIRGRADTSAQSRLTDTLSLLRTGQYETGAAAARQLARDGKAALAEMVGNTKAQVHSSRP